MNNETYHNRLANGFDQQLVPIAGSNSEVPVVLVLVGSDVPTQVQPDHPKFVLVLNNAVNTCQNPVWG